MGINLSELGLISLFEGKYDGESFYEKSLKINQENEYIRGIATCLGSLGNLATKRNDNKKAVEYYLEFRSKRGKW